MSARITANLTAALEAGDCYSALQMLKAVFRRKVTAKKVEEGMKLLGQGCQTLVKHEEWAGAAEVGVMLCDAGKEHEVAFTPAWNRTLEAIVGPFPVGSQVVDVLTALFGWAPSPAPVVFCTKMAQCRGSRGDVAGTVRVMLDSGDMDSTAAVVLSVARSLPYDQAHVPLAIAVLRLLSRGNLRDANAVRDKFMALQTASARGVLRSTPLGSFLRYLLLTLERDAAPLFKKLCSLYSAPLDELGPNGTPLVQRIGDVFYGIKKPPNMMDAMLGMLTGGGGGGRRR